MKVTKYKLLSSKQHKADKAMARGYLQGMLQLQPLYRIVASQKSRIESHGFQYVGKNLCPWAGRCAEACLDKCGYNSSVLNKNAHGARVRRTQYLLNDTEGFLNDLYADLEKLQRRADESDLLPVVRLNCLSDLYWPIEIFKAFPRIQFLDYTKDHNRALDAAIIPSWPVNYHLTLSWHEKFAALPFVDAIIAECYEHNKVNVCVVFDIAKGKPLPHVWRGRPVIDGDVDDLRFLDKSGAIVGLRFKRPLVAGGFKRSKKLSLFVLPA